MIDGIWITSTPGGPKLWFRFEQRGSDVRGVFHDEKVFTCQLSGTLTGNKLSMTYETAFSWLNIHESGSAVLDLSPDGGALAGAFRSNETSGNWLLRREGAQLQQTVPNPPGSPNLPFPIPSHHGPARQAPYVPRDPAKDKWDAQRDPAFAARLKKDAL